MLTAARVVAVAVAVPTVGVLFVNGGWRLTNAFLVPDLLVCALLLTGALLPARLAVRVLAPGFAAGAGVITTAAFSYVARGAFGLPTTVAALACAVMAVLLIRTLTGEGVRTR